MKLKVWTLISASCPHGRSRFVVGQGGFDLQMAVLRDDHIERLSWRDDASHRMHRELLDDAVNRRGEVLQLVRCSALTASCAIPAGLLLGLRQIVEHRAAEFRFGLSRVSLCAASAASASFEPALLDQQSCCWLYEVLLFRQISRVSIRAPCRTGICGLRPAPAVAGWLPGAWRWSRPPSNVRPLSARSGDRARKLGALLDDLVYEKLPMHLDLPRSHLRADENRRADRPRMSAALSRATQACRVKVAFDPVPLGRAHRPIESRPAFAGPNLLAVMDTDGTHDAGFPSAGSSWFGRWERSCLAVTMMSTCRYGPRQRDDRRWQ